MYNCLLIDSPQAHQSTWGSRTSLCWWPWCSPTWSTRWTRPLPTSSSNPCCSFVWSCCYGCDRSFSYARCLGEVGRFRMMMIAIIWSWYVSKARSRWCSDWFVSDSLIFVLSPSLSCACCFAGFCFGWCRSVLAAFSSRNEKFWTSHRMFRGCQKGFLDTNKKTNYIFPPSQNKWRSRFPRNNYRQLYIKIYKYLC